MAPNPTALWLISLALQLRDWLFWALSFAGLFLAILWASAFLYGSFYLAYMPSSQTVILPVYFLFDVDPETGRRT